MKIMNLKTIITVLLISIFISACSSPITYNVRFDGVSYDAKNRKTVVSAINSTDQFKILELADAIMGLGANIDKKEAGFVAREAVLYPKHLANQYKLVGPPNTHVVMVNTGQRERGHCYHFAADMKEHLDEGRTYNTLTLKRAVANQGRQYEHNVLTVAAKGKGISDAIILDPWRDSATLYWIKTGDDPLYIWNKYKRRTYIVNPKQTDSEKIN